ncbi:FkbM family methyltransferase [Roseovarius tolerans]|nr:FkbM family methyltransferase [Roseovarius tolerans]
MMLEIGANIGTSSIYAGLTGRFTKILAVEADARNFDLLCTNIRINNLQDVIMPVYAGVSDHMGEGLLQRHALHSGMSTLEPTENFFAQGTVSGEQSVSLRTADDILREAGIEPEDVTLVWMDIEGHEPKAFVGMSELLSHKPVIYFEYSPHRYSDDEVNWIQKNVVDAYDKARLYSDQWYDLPENGLHGLNPEEHRFHMNVLVC